MARLATLQSIRLAARRRADQEIQGTSAPLVSESELNDFINLEWTALYEMLIGFGQEYYLTSAVVVPVADVAPLPADFYKLRGVDVSMGGDSYSAHPFMFEERNRYKFSGTWRMGDVIYYRLRASNIAFIPTPTTGTTITIWYYPTPIALVGDQDTLDGVNGWEEFLILGAARRMAMKEESLELATGLEQERQIVIERVRSTAPQRDAGAPERVQDVVGWGDW